MAPASALGVPRPGRRAVVFFLRASESAKFRTVLDRWTWPPDVDVALVADDGELGRAFGLRRPRAGGTPVGYAIVDNSGRVRYATLDPHLARHLVEVRTILEAL